jgi:hypothetical protein
MNGPGRLDGSMVDLAVRVLLIGLLVGGCASMKSEPPTPITSMSQIEGKWQGTITLGFNGPMELYWLTVQPDGSFEAQYGMNWQWGKMTLTNGAATFDITAPGPSSGTVVYYAGPSTRSLSLNPTFGGWSAQVKPMTR